MTRDMVAILNERPQLVAVRYHGKRYKWRKCSLDTCHKVQWHEFNRNRPNLFYCSDEHEQENQRLQYRARKQRWLEKKQKIVRGHWPKGKRRSDLSADEVGWVVEILRAKLDDGISQREIGRQLGMPSKSISRWLAGQRWPSSESARKILALEISI